MLDGYLVRGDFSRWIEGVFGDHALAEELRRLQERHRTASRTDTLAEIVAAIERGMTWHMEKWPPTCTE